MHFAYQMHVACNLSFQIEDLTGVRTKSDLLGQFTQAATVFTN